VRDLGCGTGENARFLASRGHPNLGHDFAARAIDRARAQLSPGERSIRFEVGNALELAAREERFDTEVDCGLFHTFLDPHRSVYAAGVASVLTPRGRFFVLCFSEPESLDWGGPRRVTEAELRSTFGGSLRERWIREARFETRAPSIQGRGWLGSFGARGPARPSVRQPHPPRRTR
jgi:ubiquinone/menaquinone biosynthesis C-methylase UbiE